MGKRDKMTATSDPTSFQYAGTRGEKAETRKHGNLETLSGKEQSSTRFIVIDYVMLSKKRLGWARGLPLLLDELRLTGKTPRYDQTINPSFNPMADALLHF